MRTTCPREALGNQLSIGSVLLVLAVAAAALASPAWAQTTPTPPHPDFVLADQRDVNGLNVQRWVDKAAPEISPAGMCHCITVVYEGARLALTVGQPGLLSAMTVHEISGRDVNRDGYADVVVTDWSGGAHCCYSIDIYSLEPTTRPLLSLATGNCQADELTDLDGDGRLELVTCDDGWANAYCAFAFSPMPRVVYAYDERARAYVPATPRFAARLHDELTAAIAEAEREIAGDSGGEIGRHRCAALGPALSLMYVGRIDDGMALMRRLYTRPDREPLERETLERVRSSPMWVDGAPPPGR